MPCTAALLIFNIHDVPDCVIRILQEYSCNFTEAWYEDIMMTHGKIMMLAGIILSPAVSIASAVGLAEGYTSTKGIVPVLIWGNSLTCTDMVCASRTFLRIDKDGDESSASDYAGTYPLGSSGTLTIIATDDTTIAWTSDVDINCIFMKGGLGGNSYGYDPPARSDSGLSTPLDAVNGKPNGVNHINICYTPPGSVPELRRRPCE